MQEQCVNIYKNARRTAGLTQERWAEAIGCSVESVRNYEAGSWLPGDDIVRRMCEISGLTVLAYWHVCEKSGLVNDLFPTLRRLPLPQATIELMLAIKQYAENEPELLKLVEDAEISADELIEWGNVVRNLNDVICAALQVKFAEGVPNHA